ncbi:ankyrin repeat domain-containing protein [Chitinophaga filiformis]|uniref:Ankyrin repeat domain-containing protein n=1 Tax=Chitinophaga filiformis TaxID=104663 RepID=A0ABY4I9E6_CHIFI|nr:ankyrin repeat domain-containing protein [Chitinophaga filiformis]UPK72283.1 ankyrin repeat domain-containing protein [Chitinophaga filiformis]
MSLFSKFFKKKEEATPPQEENPLPWIAPEDNPWQVRLLDMRPITETMLSTSKDEQMAQNAVSYNSEDGLVFLEQLPLEEAEIAANLTFPVDGKLYPGVLFIPQVMEHKWAIYFHDNKLIFVRSWMRQVYVTAQTRQENGMLIVESIRGSFGEEKPAHTISILHFLMTGYVRNQVVPAPLPEELKDNTRTAAMWSFSMFGNLAKIGVFDEQFTAPSEEPLRSHTMLHIAVAEGNLDVITSLHQQGYNLNALAGDGLTALQWGLVAEDTLVLEHLLALGAHPDARSAEGATTLMNAVQSKRLDVLQLLIKAGADVNAQDDRGFTALHRAAEMGLLEIAEALLATGADKHIIAQGHTPVSLAAARQEEAMIQLLQ